MGLKFKAEISFIDKKTNLPVVKEMIMDSAYGADDAVYEMIRKDGHDKVDVEVNMYDDQINEWFQYNQRVFYNADIFEREFMLVCNGAHEASLIHTWCEAHVVHLKSNLIFGINSSEVTYNKNLLEDPEVIFYKFKCTEESGKVYRFSLICNLRGNNCTPEKLAEIKETILKPGAQWYCEHFREKYRDYRGEDAMTKSHQRREEIKKEKELKNK